MVKWILMCAVTLLACSGETTSPAPDPDPEPEPTMPAPDPTASTPAFDGGAP